MSGFCIVERGIYEKLRSLFCLQGIKEVSTGNSLVLVDEVSNSLLYGCRFLILGLTYPVVGYGL
jgi:hypothetical protein